MHCGPETLLDGANRAFNLANMSVRGNDVQSDGKDGVTDTFKLMVSVHVGKSKTTRRVLVLDATELG